MLSPYLLTCLALQSTSKSANVT